MLAFEDVSLVAGRLPRHMYCRGYDVHALYKSRKAEGGAAHIPARATLVAGSKVGFPIPLSTLQFLYPWTLDIPSTAHHPGFRNKDLSCL